MVRTVVTPGIGRGDRVHVKPRLVVERLKLSYLEEQGWVRDGNRFYGEFRARNGARLGQVLLDGGQLHFFIYDPPREVFEGPHGPCFVHAGDNWFWINFRRKASNPSDGIMEVERVLNGAARS